MTCEAHSTVVNITAEETPDELPGGDDFDVEEARDLQTALDWASNEVPDFLFLTDRLPPRRDDEPGALSDLRDKLDEISTAWSDVADRLYQASVTAEELVAEMEEAGDV